MTNEIPYGYCQCGCGQKTKIAKQTNTKLNWIKGEPIRFIKGHHCRVQNRNGSNNANWKGGNRAFGRNYRCQFAPNHPRAVKNYVLEHILIAEKALGKLLPPNAVVHHHTSEHLVVCQDQAYHNTLHRRMRALKECGRVHWKKCKHCGAWDDPQNMYVNKRGTAHHKKCENAYARQRRIIEQLGQPMTIIQDSREQKPYTFTCITPSPVIKVAALKTGDYSLEGSENQIVIERKNLSDLYSTFGRGRRRFQLELERMVGYQFAAVVIESDWETILRRPPARSRLHPQTVLASVIAWTQRYGVHFFTCPDRYFAERFTYRLLERFARDQNGKGR